MKYLSKSLVLLGFVVGIVCIAYPLVLWGIGQTVFPEQANGSILYGPDGRPVGSRLIAQPFTKDEYFQPRPSAVSYAAEASGPSNLSSSNYGLRARVASMLGPIVKYQSAQRRASRWRQTLRCGSRKTSTRETRTSWRNGRMPTTAWPRRG